jgi:hypothetical protein
VAGLKQYVNLDTVMTTRKLFENLMYVHKNWKHCTANARKVFYLLVKRFVDLKISLIIIWIQLCRCSGKFPLIAI